MQVDGYSSCSAHSHATAEPCLCVIVTAVQDQLRGGRWRRSCRHITASHHWNWPAATRVRSNNHSWLYYDWYYTWCRGLLNIVTVSS